MISLTASSSPEKILKAWNSQTALADSLLSSIEGDAVSSSEVKGSIDALKRISISLENVYSAAIKRAEFEDRCGWFSYRKVLSFSGTVLDTSFQVLTMTLMANSINSSGSTSPSAFSVVGSTLASVVASKIKDYIWKRNETLLTALAQMEEIIPNKLVIEHINSMVAFYESTKSRPKISADRTPKVGLSRSLREGNHIMSLSQVVSHVMSSQCFKKGELREKYIIKLYGVYSVLNEEAILDLTQKFIDLKDLMVNEESVIKEVRQSDPDGNVIVIINQLDEQVKELRTIFSDARHIIELSDEMEKTRARCVTNGFRSSIQILLELGSLAGSIVEAVYANSGSSSAPAKVAGFSLYIANIALSWMNTGISKIRETNALTFQQIKRLDGQKIFEKHVSGLINEARRTARRTKSYGALDKKETASLPSLVDRAPLVGSSGSPLRDRILKLYQESRAGGDREDWRKYLGEAAGQEELSPPKLVVPQQINSEIVLSPYTMRKLEKQRQLTVAELFIPDSEAQDSSWCDRDSPPIEEVIDVVLDEKKPC